MTGKLFRAMALTVGLVACGKNSGTPAGSVPVAKPTVAACSPKPRAVLPAPMVDCEPRSDEGITETKERVRDEVAKKYGESSTANLIRYVRANYMDVEYTYIGAAEGTPDYEAREKAFENVFYGLALLGDFWVNEVSAKFLIALFNDIPLHGSPAYNPRIRSKIAYELGRAFLTESFDARIGMLTSDPDFEVRVIAGEGLVCQRNSLDFGQKGELLRGLRDALYRTNHPGETKRLAKALADLGNPAAIGVLTYALEKAREGRYGPEVEDTLTTAIERLRGSS